MTHEQLKQVQVVSNKWRCSLARCRKTTLTKESLVRQT